jgi:hypothetical protein
MLELNPAMTPHRILGAVALLVAVTHSPAAAADFRGRGHGAPHDGRFLRHPRTVVIVAPGPISGFDYVSPPAYATPPPVYVPVPVAYPPAPTSYQPASMPRVIEHATGRYELRGDGVTAPYVWVWIPNPPAAPPPPPSAPPAADPDPPRGRPAPRPGSQSVYRWTDDRGVTTWTDNLEKVPPRYRAEAKATMP